MPITRLDDDLIAAFAKTAVAEDVGSGDITSNAVVPEGAELTAVMAARERMVLAGLPLAEAVCAEVSPDISFERRTMEGAEAEDGDMLAILKGPARAILSAERTALNIVQHLSGIATLTRAFVKQMEGSGAVLLDTRKTIPGLRKLEKYASRLGGAQNHRMGLYDAILIKDNHIAVSKDGNTSGITSAIKRARAAGDWLVEVECDTLDQVREALAAKADMIMLDNMSLEDMHHAVEITQDHAKEGTVQLEASGGVTLETIRAIAETGVDFISVGRITQSAPAVDIGLDFMD